MYRRDKQARLLTGGIVGASSGTTGRRGVGTTGTAEATATLRTRGYIGAAPAGIDPADHFKAVTYTGSYSDQTVTVGFQPDFAWIKCRNTVLIHSVWDSLRGSDKLLASDTSGDETTVTNSVVTTADGMTLLGGYSRVNDAAGGRTYVAWCLKAGGAGVDNYDGSIDSTVSANVDAGFSIVTYTGNGATADVGHGLSAKPELIITKALSTSQWIVHHDGLQGNTASDDPWNLYLNGTDDEQDLAAFGAYGDITADTFRVDRESTYSAHNNNSGTDYVAYCFHSVPGFSKVGSYTGDGGTSNSVELGFRPAFLMVKRTDVADDWIILDNARDTTNPRQKHLYANELGVEGTTAGLSVDFDDTGFTLTGAKASINATSGDYIYLAFAESNTLSGPGRGMLTLYDRYVDTLT